jgi:hypothetical protein
MIYDVKIFLDEHTLYKLENKADFIKYVEILLSSSKKISSDKFKVSLTRSIRFEKCKLKTGQTITEAINMLLPTEIRRRFKKEIYERSKDIWNIGRLHSSNDYYTYNEQCVTDESLAESAEAVYLKVKGVIVYMNKTPQILNKISVVKDECINILVPVLHTELDHKTWLDNEFDISLLEYDYNSKSSPKDLQTYLRDRTNFKKIKGDNQGRLIYQDKLTLYFHSVDNIHHGKKSHVEVWNKHGRYLGEASLSGELNTDIPNKKKEEKHNPHWLL